MGKGKNHHKGWHTTRKERISYYVGTGAIYGQYALVGGCLSVFLIMSGIDMAAVAVILLIMKGFDAVNDLMVGYIVDRINPHNHPKLARFVGEGQYMPWMRLCTFMLPVAGVLLYLMPSGLNQPGKLIWFALFYLAVDITYTLVDVPGNALITTITGNVEERNSMIGVRIFPTMVFQLIVTVVPTILFSENVGLPMGLSVAAVLIFMALCTIPLIRNVKEHNADEIVENEEYSTRDMLTYLKKNKYLAVLYSGVIIRLICGTGSAVSLFVCFYLFHSTLFSLIYTVCALVPMVLITVITPKILKKIDSGTLLIAVSVIGIFTCAALYFAGYSNPTLHIIIYVINVIPGTFMTVLLGFMCPNCVEYGKYKSGIDGTGISFAVNTFSIKVGGAIASSLGIAMLGLFGWISVEAESFAQLAEMNVMQTQTALNGLWFVNAGMPLIGTVIGAVIWFFYRLKDKDVAVMIRCNEGEITREEAEAQMSRKY